MPWAAMRSPERRFTRTAPDTIAAAVEVCRRQPHRRVRHARVGCARTLLSHVTGLDASAVVAYGDTPSGANRREELEALTAVASRASPSPTSSASKSFAAYALRVDRRVLVPAAQRPKSSWPPSSTDWRGRQAEILDLGTGSAAIACALADLLPKVTVVATDVSDPALKVAADNVLEFALGDRIELSKAICSTLWHRSAAIRCHRRKLPYVARADGSWRPMTRRTFEPADALDAGPKTAWPSTGRCSSAKPAGCGRRAHLLRMRTAPRRVGRHDARAFPTASVSRPQRPGRPRADGLGRLGAAELQGASRRAAQASRNSAARSRAIETAWKSMDGSKRFVADAWDRPGGGGGLPPS